MRYKMRNLRPFLAFCFVVSSFSQYVSAQNTTGQIISNEGIMSPNGKIKVACVSDGQGNTQFEVKYGMEQAVEVFSLLDTGIRTADDSEGVLKLQQVSSTRTLHDEYDMPTGKRSHCSNYANERTFTFADSQGREQMLTFRAYNDGVAFRYELGKGYKDTQLQDERTTYHMSKGNRWLQKYDMSYENFFPLNPAESNADHWAYPSLFETGSGVFTLLSEANITRGHSASSLKSGKGASQYKVYVDENKSVVSTGWKSPWRIAIIGSLADVAESTLVTDVSEPCKIGQTDWIKPGCASWIYWAHNRGSKDFQIVKEYIDMAGKLKLPYVLIDWEWDVMGNGGTIEDALKLADQQKVRTLLWYNSSTAWTTNGAGGPLFKLNKLSDREKEFAELQQKGVAGVKIDFFAGDTQATMDYCIDLLESAAKYKLLVNFHGATIPRGWQRTYPNLMTTEGVYGAEWYNNAPILTNKAASHNATLPFTRGVVGSMDYTPCTFSDSQHPHITTHAHELALTVLFESGIQHLADRPSSYLSQPRQVQDFFTNLPTAWDETKLLGGYPGDYVAMARRKGNTWYVGVLNGTDEARSISLDWSFLNKSKSKALLFQDSGNSDSPWVISKVKPEALPNQVKCLPRGGFVAVVTLGK